MYILFRLHTFSTSIRCRMQDKNIFKMLQSSYAVHSSRESESEYVISTLCLYHTRRLKAPCSSKLVTVKMTPCSKASTQEHRRKFLSPQQYERNIQERYLKQQTKIGLGSLNKKTYWKITLFNERKLKGFLFVPPKKSYSGGWITRCTNH